MFKSRITCAQLISLLCCVIYNFHIHTSEHSPSFDQCVDLISTGCKEKKITDPTIRALLYIADELPKSIHSPAYKTFQQCDLSRMMSELPTQYPQLFDKLIPENDPHAKYLNESIQNLTLLRSLQGKLAQHNPSITYRANETSLFQNISDNKLDMAKERYRYRAYYFGLIQGMTNVDFHQWNDNLTADLIEQEICLRNNAKKLGEPRILECQILFKSKNPQKPNDDVVETSPKESNHNEVTEPAPPELAITSQPALLVPEQNISPTQHIDASNISSMEIADIEPFEPEPERTSDSNSAESQSDTKSMKETVLHSDDHQKDEVQFTAPPHRKLSYRRPIFIILSLIALYYRHEIISFLSNYYQKNFAY